MPDDKAAAATESESDSESDSQVLNSESEFKT